MPKLLGDNEIQVAILIHYIWKLQKGCGGKWEITNHIVVALCAIPINHCSTWELTVTYIDIDAVAIEIYKLCHDNYTQNVIQVNIICGHFCFSILSVSMVR
jgi:hypothetical protein